MRTAILVLVIAAMILVAYIYIDYSTTTTNETIAVPTGIAAYIGVGESGAGERPYAYDKLRVLCERSGYDFDRAHARLSELMRAFEGKPTLAHYDKWIDKIEREITAALTAGLSNDGYSPGLFVNEGTQDRPDLKPSRVDFVRWLCREHIFAAPSDTFGERGFELFFYDDGCFRDGAVALVHARIEDAFEHVGLTASQTFSQETVRSIVRRSLKPRSSFNPPEFLNLENGTYEIATGELHPHSPARRFTWQLPIKYDPSATHPTFDTFLAEVLPQEKTRREIQKLFGYCIGVPGHPYQCAHLFVGEGNNGKSTLLAILNALLGKENVAAETLTSLTENRFAPANLWGKLANVFADLPSNPLRYSSVFKALTGGDKVRAEAKFGKTFYFVNGAKLVFSANELPEVIDRTRAFWRRWYLIRFDQDFTGREDRGLLGSILAELPGILNWALAGIPMLQQDRGFLTELGADDLKAEWRKRSDTLAWFVAEQVIVDPTERTPKDEFYEAYALFCGRNGASPKSPEMVGKEIAKHVPSVRTEQHRMTPGAPPTRCWHGICLRPDSQVQPPATRVTPATATVRTTLAPDAVAGVAGVTGCGTTVPGRGLRP